MKTNRIFLLLPFVLMTALSTSCVKDSVEAPPTLEQLVETSVTYGPDDRQRMTVALPEGRDTETPIVILIHGGAWISGNKEDLSGLQQFLLENQIGSVSINYRFASDNHHFEGLMEDVGLAVASVNARARDWGIRTDGYQLLGVSAGAHMALLYAYHFGQNTGINSVISAAGPTAFPDEFLGAAAVSPLRAPIEAMVGAPLEMPYSPRFSAASPLTYADDAVPTLLIHGTADTTVPYALSTTLASMLQNRGKTVQLITLTGAGHDFLGDPAAAVQALNSVLTWIKTHG